MFQLLVFIIKGNMIIYNFYVFFCVLSETGFFGHFSLHKKREKYRLFPGKPGNRYSNPRSNSLLGSVGRLKRLASLSNKTEPHLIPQTLFKIGARTIWKDSGKKIYGLPLHQILLFGVFWKAIHVYPLTKVYHR